MIENYGLELSRRKARVILGLGSVFFHRTEVLPLDQTTILLIVPLFILTSHSGYPSAFLLYREPLSLVFSIVQRSLKMWSAGYVQNQQASLYLILLLVSI